MEHDFHDCSRDGCMAEEGYCYVCDAGLISCKVCKGVGGALPNHCPGTVMSGFELEAIYRRLLDFDENGEPVYPKGYEAYLDAQPESPNV